MVQISSRETRETTAREKGEKNHSVSSILIIMKLVVCAVYDLSSTQKIILDQMRMAVLLDADVSRPK
jgi:uncharacterized membrane protein